MNRYVDQAVQAIIRPIEGKFLQVRCNTACTPAEVTVGMGESWSVLACKEVYGKGIKAVLEQDFESCCVDLTAAAKLGDTGIFAAAEGIYGGAYKMKNSLTFTCEPSIPCYACGEGFTDEVLEKAVVLAKNIMQARNLLNRPGNMLTPALFAQQAKVMAEGLPIEVQVYSKEEMEQLGMGAILAVGTSSGNDPCMIVMRYNGDPDSDERLGYVGKGITYDTGGYNLKPGNSLYPMKGDMGGAAAVMAAICAIAANGVKANVTAVIPACENRITPTSFLPGDVITSYSGQTIEIFSTDAEGRLILCDGLTWAIRNEKATRLVDVATLTGAVVVMLGRVATGVMANDDDWYAALEQAGDVAGERYWRMPHFPEYEELIESDYADIRNTTKDGCSSIAAALFLKRFTEDVPWLHLDIAGTADVKSPVWQHQVKGGTGTATATLYHLADK